MTKNLRHDCSRNGCYMDTLWDWSPLNDCFGSSGIRVSDVDGLVERNGQFLILDGKRIWRDKRDISDGQRLVYRRFAELGGTVLVFHGQPPSGVEYLRQWLPGGRFVPEIVCDINGLRALVSAWFTQADLRRTA